MRRFPLLFALCAVLVCSCGKEMQEPAARTVTNEERTALAASVYVPGQMTVYFDDELVSLVESGDALRAVATRAAVAGLDPTLLDELGVSSFERVFPVDEEFEARHREFGLHRWYRVRFNDAVPSPEAVKRFSLLPGVLNTRPVLRARRTEDAYFNDPLEGRQWHYHNPYTSWADVNALPVWQNYTTGSEKVIVSVVDGGIDLKHEDLKDAVVQPGDNGSKSFMFSGSPYVIKADDHGTHVAGTIGAVNNNGKGVAGLAGGNAAAGIKGVRLMSCQIFSDGNNDGSDSGAAIVWGADHGAVISNNSWGYIFFDAKGNYDKVAAEEAHDFYEQPNSGAYKDEIKDAVDYFNKYAGMNNGVQTGPMAGGLVVFAAGNDGRPWGPPANYSGCMAVGAINSYGGKTNFSNYGSWVDICAPGLDILSTAPNNEYALMSGTSMACPHVSGVAALVVSYCGGIGFTREQLWEKLVGGANSADVPASFRIGPLVDAFGAIAYGSGEPPAVIEDYSVDSVLSNNVTFSCPVPPDRDGKPAYGVRLLASESSDALLACDPRSPGEGVIYGDVVCRDLNVGDRVTGTVGDLGFSTTYYIAFSAFDYGRNFSSISKIGTVTTGENHAPVIETSYTGEFKFHVHDFYAIPFTITDADNHSLNVVFDKDENDEGALVLGERNEAGEYRLQVIGYATPAGKYHGVLRAEDNYGLSTELGIDYEVLPNSAPELVKPMDNIILHYSGDTVKINMEDYIVDPDGETLTYAIDISDKSVVHVTQKAGSAVLTVTALADSGLATVTLSATDAGDAVAEASVKVLVVSGEQEVLYYPNPVIDYLYVGPVDNPGGNATVSVFNAVGAKVYSASLACSAFEPAQIDMRNAGAGLYNLKVEYGGKVFNSVIIKK
ncbi:MAG: S8 family serine peptidase [Bacteroidales bacterium]|nr:S8 family serine peptidase [Bacteroidales bacterium]